METPSKYRSQGVEEVDEIKQRIGASPLKDRVVVRIDGPGGCAAAALTYRETMALVDELLEGALAIFEDEPDEAKA